MAVDRSGGAWNGTIYLAWANKGEGSDRSDIYFSKSTNGGTNWTSPKRVNDDNTSNDQWFPSITVDPSGLISIVYYDSRSDGNNMLTEIWGAQSADSGHTFTNMIMGAPNDNFHYLYPLSGLEGYADGYMGDYIGIASATSKVIPCWMDKPTDSWYQAYVNALDTYQQDLFVLANQNRSTSYAATSYNNNHLIEKDASGRLHFVFQSGGEIFYRRSTDTGSSWDITRRISDGGGSYDAPCIAVAHDGSLQAVWQKKLSNNYYNLLYSRSTDVGNSWTTTSLISNVGVSYYQSNDGSGQGPTPVIAAMNGSQTKLLCVWAQSDGLSYKTDSSTSGWYTNIWTVPGTLDNNSVWHPSVATYGISSTSANMTYDDRFNALYSQRFDANVSPSGAWSSQTTAANGTSDRLSSLAINPWGGMYGVWSYWNGSQWAIRFRYGDAASNSWGWTYEFVDPYGYDSFYPVVSHFENPADYHCIQILSSAYGGGPYRTEIELYYWYYDFWDDTPATISDNGIFANMTHEWYSETYPTRVWTDLTGSPYQIEDLTSGFNKTGRLATQGEAKPYRAVEIFDRKNRVKFILRLSGLNFKKYDYRQKLDLNLSNVFDYLQTETFIPNAGSTLSVRATTSVVRQDTLANGKVSTAKEKKFKGIELVLQVLNGTSKIGEIPFLCSDQPNNNFEKTIVLDQYASKSVALIPKVILSGEYDKKDVSFTLVNGVEGSPSPNGESPVSELANGVTLGQNYPNPFNPTTTIAYRVTRSGKVSLKIFDLLGREVATLVNSEKADGVYTEKYDASHLSSGIYFYQLIAPGVNETRKMLIAK